MIQASLCVEGVRLQAGKSLDQFPVLKHFLNFKLYGCFKCLLNSILCSKVESMASLLQTIAVTHIEEFGSADEGCTLWC